MENRGRLLGAQTQRKTLGRFSRKEPGLTQPVAQRAVCNDGEPVQPLSDADPQIFYVGLFAGPDLKKGSRRIVLGVQPVNFLRMEETRGQTLSLTGLVLLKIQSERNACRSAHPAVPTVGDRKKATGQMGKLGPFSWAAYNRQAGVLRCAPEKGCCRGSQ